MCVERAINRSADQQCHSDTSTSAAQPARTIAFTVLETFISLLSCSELQWFVHQLSCFHVEIKPGQWPVSVLRTASFKRVCTLGVSWEQCWIPAILAKTPQTEPRLHF